MRFKNFLLILLIFLFYNTEARSAGFKSIAGKYAPMDINQWLLWESSEVINIVSPYKAAMSNQYPIGTGHLLYTDGFVWGGFVRDGRSPALRAGGSYYRNGVVPGWIVKPGDGVNPPQAVSPDDPRVRIYRIRKDIFDIDDEELRQDAAIFFNISADSVTSQQIDSLRQLYLKDWREWPADLGAPYYDRNQNGVYDPDYDEPGIVGADQVIWYAFNDLKEYKTMTLFGCPPIGLEIQVTVWAYKIGLSEAVFKRYRIFNKSGYSIDSMFVSQYLDADVGDFHDNLAGCDSVLMYGFAYNSRSYDEEYSRFFMVPPAVAGVLLQGPAVPSPGDTAIVDFQKVPDFKNLPMTSFWLHQTGGAIPSPELGVYEGTMLVYAILNGYAGIFPDGVPFPQLKVSFYSRQPTKFPANGDPVTGTGDVDGKNNSLPPGVRYFFINSGPFNMAPGDMQEIIVAYVAVLEGTEGDNISTVRNLQRIVPTVHKTYQEMVNFSPPVGPRSRKSEPSDSSGVFYFMLGQNFPNPFSGNTHIKFKLFKSMQIRLDVFNLLGQKIRTIYAGNMSRGEHFLRWDGKNTLGLKVPAGVYLLRLKSGALMQWRKLIILK